MNRITGKRYSGAFQAEFFEGHKGAGSPSDCCIMFPKFSYNEITMILEVLSLVLLYLYPLCFPEGNFLVD